MYPQFVSCVTRSCITLKSNNDSTVKCLKCSFAHGQLLRAVGHSSSWGAGAASFILGGIKKKAVPLTDRLTD